MHHSKRVRLKMVAACLMVVAAAGFAAHAADGPVGEWEIVSDAGGQTSTATLTIEEDGGKLSGTIVSDQGALDISDAKFEDDTLTFVLNIDAQGQELVLKFSGKIDGDSIDGSWGSDFGDFPATGKRAGATALPVGDWEIVTDAGGETIVSTLTLREDGGKLSGTIASDIGTSEIVDPKFEDGTLTFNITIDAEGQELALAFSGKVDGDSIDGSWGSDLGDFPATGKRAGATGAPVGDWEVVTDTGGEIINSVLTIKEDGGKLSGTISSDGVATGLDDPKFEDGTLTFAITIDAEGQELTLEFSAKIDGDSFDATWASEFGDFPATVKRAGGGASFVGTWTLSVDSQLGVNERTLVVNEDGTGTYGGGDFAHFAISNVKVDGNKFECDVTLDVQGQELPSHITLTLEDGKVSGDLNFGQGEASIEGSQ